MIAGTTGSLLDKGKNIKNKRTFTSRFFELLRTSLRLNTQRRSASSMCAFKKEERCVLISVTLMTGIAGYNTVPTIDITFCMYVRVQPCKSDLKERFISLIVCLFITIFFCHPHFSFFSSYFFCYLHFFHPHSSIRIFLSTFSHPHPPSAGIRSAFYRHPIMRVLLAKQNWGNILNE